MAHRQWGVGNWKSILNDPQFKFDGRSPVDLKDRYVSVLYIIVLLLAAGPCPRHGPGGSLGRIAATEDDGFHWTPHNLGVLLGSAMTVSSPVSIPLRIHRWNRMIVFGVCVHDGPHIHPRSPVTYSARCSDYMRDQAVPPWFCVSDWGSTTYAICVRWPAVPITCMTLNGN